MKSECSIWMLLKMVRKKPAFAANVGLKSCRIELMPSGISFKKVAIVT